MAIAVVGMLDEREEALSLIKDQIERRGHQALLIDISIGTGAIVPSLKADVSCRELVQLGGGPAEGVEAMLMGQREKAISMMAEGLIKKISVLHASGDLQGFLAISGMTGALIALPAMKSLPFGLPKLIISSALALPVHAEQFANYFAVQDITVMHAVVDTVGMNALVQKLAVNGANAISGMVEAAKITQPEQKPAMAITEFGFCDKGAHYLRELLEKDFEIVSFHATGLGDRAAMELVPQGVFKAFIDLVPGAFSEHLLGANRGTCGPGRLEIASKTLIPYILCPGGFDIISCGPIERRGKNDPLWTSRKLADRKLYIQESPRVQARMSAEEMASIAAAAAECLNGYRHKKRVKVIIPLKGFSSLSEEGGPLYDPDSDRAFAVSMKKILDPEIDITEVEAELNSRAFAAAVVRALREAQEEIRRLTDS
ncbi:MAG TPA: Tm-1-like ATP-binding domain-containing protein [Acidobacteriota bacterium]|nr:Tm-1-like ATP-binding domain-containing protein [Acidobacteriota bacterium]